MATTNRVTFIGANPGVLIRDDRGPACFASIWRTEWSPAGAGDTVIVVDRRSWRGFGRDRRLAEYLAVTYTQWFPEVGGLAPLLRLEWLATDLEIELDARSGARTNGRGLSITIGEPAGMVPVARPFRLGPDVAALSNVSIPCRHGTIEVDGLAVAGETAAAFLALAEVWSIDS